jgi:hypothetical protein
MPAGVRLAILGVSYLCYRRRLVHNLLKCSVADRCSSEMHFHVIGYAFMYLTVSQTPLTQPDVPLVCLPCSYEVFLHSFLPPAYSYIPV